jgi:hypothetical protein
MSICLQIICSAGGNGARAWEVGNYREMFVRKREGLKPFGGNFIARTVL